MDTFVKAVITGFGLSVGKLLFEKVKQRLERKEDEPERVIVVNASEFHKPASS